jgi:hypothetical protein
MSKIIAMSALGLVCITTTTTLYISSQLQQNQCASLSLPLDFKVAIGSRCQKSLVSDRQTP